jgi:hypothetical protein
LRSGRSFCHVGQSVVGQVAAAPLCHRFRGKGGVAAWSGAGHSAVTARGCRRPRRGESGILMATSKAAVEVRGHPFVQEKLGVLRQDVSGDKVRLQAFAGTAIEAFDRTSSFPVQISGNICMAPAIAPSDCFFGTNRGGSAMTKCSVRFVLIVRVETCQDLQTTCRFDE